MTGETLASKLVKQLSQYGVDLATAQVGEIMSLVDTHYRVVREENSTYELEDARAKLEELQKDSNHLAEIVKALEEAFEAQQTRLRALKESVSIVATPRGFDALFKTRPPEEQRQRALLRTANWVLNGQGKAPTED